MPTDGLRRSNNSVRRFTAPAGDAPNGEHQRFLAAQFKPGRLVRIRRGAFAGIEGAVLRNCGNSRLIVALALSQSGVYLEIDAEMLDAID